ncbi:hypothetical protein ANRL4_04472 [Anaerolineae bacterium]|nr:hypothetical protein ANRL4_04472 [Anaerolineae bacterium]
MSTKIDETLYVCMGSACHQSGVYQVLPVLQRLLEEHGFEGHIALKGAFCLGPCMDGIVIKLGERLILQVNLHTIERKFQEEILPLLQQGTQL